ncbi:hypothetical protein AB0D49_20855 [Streptomyces sp. NPDC048290]|uniref:hypothetical protein n=1 Tax=Streptomyces sp. NPDC048290 TaxID=3155811 RepID=UPI0034381609
MTGHSALTRDELAADELRAVAGGIGDPDWDEAMSPDVPTTRTTYDPVLHALYEERVGADGRVVSTTYLEYADYF